MQVMTYKELCRKEYIEVYSLQQPRVIKRLEEGSTYVPVWSESAAFSKNIEEYSRKAHERAYLWKKSQFEKRKRRCIKDWLFWFWLDKRKIEIAKKTGDKQVNLFVPVNEILISIHNGWHYVLWGDRWGGILKEDENPPINIEPIAENSIEESWEKIFDIKDDHLILDERISLQGVIDRVQPEWVKEIIVLK